jgi:MFS family permease
VLVPLALAQFICSFAGSNMNVMINDISADLNTTVKGVQTAITIFLLVMAALMIPGGKLTDRYGRKRCFTIGLVVYGIGALLSAVAPGLGLLIIGNSILEGVGTALLIPPVYILTTLLFTEVSSRARAFGAISAMGGIGAAAGPLIGGLITSTISWRAAFVFQALVIAVIVLLSRRIEDPLPADPTRPFDTGGAFLSAVGLVLIVMGILAADDNAWLMIALIVVGALVLVWFFGSVRAKERAGQEPLLSMDLFRNQTSNLGLVTQITQWLLLLGVSLLRRDPDRRDLHRGNRRPAGVVARRRAPCQAARTADPHPGRLRRHDRRHRGPAHPGEWFPERLGLRAWTPPDRTRNRHHADPVGQRRAVELRQGAAGRDLGPVAQCLQSRLLPRHRDRRHHPRRRPRLVTRTLLRAGAGHPGGDRPHRAGGLGLPARGPYSVAPASTA